MAVPEAHVTLVCELFPGQSALIERLTEENERFQSLCEDYGLAAETLAILEIRNLPQDLKRVHEYRILVRDLERDIAKAIQASGSKAALKSD